VLVWADFVLLAVPAAAAALAGAVVAIGRRAERRATHAEVAPRPRVARRVAVAAAVLAVLACAVAFAVLPSMRERLDDRLLREIAERGAARLAAIAALSLAPLALLGAVAALDVVLARRGLAWNLRLGRRWALAVGLVVVAAFLAVPWTSVAYERRFLDLPDFLAAAAAAIASNNLAFDQDRLTWKFWFGAFGWHDVLYPDVVYALARWAAVALAIALPVLSVRFTVERPARSALLLVVSGLALSLVTASLLSRHAAMIHPYGRFAMPWLPLVALPALSRLQAPGRERAWRLVLAAGALLQVWTAIALVGARYLVLR
jgi:hypothetical protein